MLEGIDINQRVEFVSKFDKTNPKTKFILKPLAGCDMLGTNIGDNPLLSLIVASVDEIKNFKGKEGKDDKEEIIRSLPSKVFNELLDQINQMNEVTDDDRKN